MWPHAEALQADDDERARAADRRQYAGPAVHRGAAQSTRWLSDTSEFVIAGSAKLYLAAILDLYSRFIAGWALSTVMTGISRSARSIWPCSDAVPRPDSCTTPISSTYVSDDYRAGWRATGSCAR